MAGPERTRGIGLGNIRERIEFHFGLPYGVVIERAEGQGTRVRIRLPLKVSR